MDLLTRWNVLDLKEENIQAKHRQLGGQLPADFSELLKCRPNRK
jgi:hypothetical protein